MANYKLSKAAEDDIAYLYEYGILTFGYNQARLYLEKLQEHFLTLTENPSIGRDASEFREGLMRFIYKSHVIFYQLSDNHKSELLIVRVLSHRMDFNRHL